jgi:hypothetical protein
MEKQVSGFSKTTGPFVRLWMPAADKIYIEDWLLIN